MGDSKFLFASLIWGSIGMGLAIYGKKQGSPVPLCGGIVLIAISYFVASALYMSLIGLAIVIAIPWLAKRVG